MCRVHGATTAHELGAVCNMGSHVNNDMHFSVDLHELGSRLATTVRGMSHQMKPTSMAVDDGPWEDGAAVHVNQKNEVVDTSDTQNRTGGPDFWNTIHRNLVFGVVVSRPRG
jgi:hypothetical protein